MESFNPSTLLRFVAEHGKRSCRMCLMYHNQIFAADDPKKPQLPLHPNCRCYYEVCPVNRDITAEIKL